jgi:hypothetical protein
MAKLKITNEKELQDNIKKLEGGFRSDVHMVPTTIEGTDDTVDIPHIGYGFKIDKKDYAFYNLLEDGTQDPNKPAYVMSRDVAEKRFLKEYNKAHTAAKKLAKAKNITGFEKIAAFTDIAYNMGTEWYLKFPSAMEALDNGDYLEFTKELLRGQDRYTKSKYVKDVGIERVTQNTLPFGYDHTKDYNSGALYEYQSNVLEPTSFMNLDTDMYIQPDMLGADSSVDRLGFVNPNINKEGPNARVRGDVNLGFRSPQGFVNIGMDDKRNVRGEGGIYTPYGTLTGNTEENYSFQGNPFRVGDASVRLSADSMQGPRLDVNRGPLSIQATENFLRANYKDLSATLTDEEITATYNLNPNVLLSGRYSKNGDFNVGVKGRFRFQEGGEVEQPSLTSSVLPNETVQPTGFVDNIPSADTVDTTQGFYSLNPAPGESGADFEQRTMQYTQPVDIPKVKASSFRPPEGYVSPRISNPFMGGSGKGTTLDYTDTSGLGSTSVSLPTDSGLSESQIAALTTLGTFSDVMAGEDAKQGATPGFTAKYWADSFNDFDPDITLDLPDILKTPDPRASAWLAETNELRAANGTAPLTMQHAEQFISVMDTIDSIANIDPAALTREMGNITIGGTTVNVFDVPGAIDVNGLNVDAIKQGLGDPLKVFGAPMAEDVTFATNEDGSIDYTKTVSGEDLTTSPFDNIKNTIEKVGNTHLFTMQDGTYSVELKDLYDEFTAAILVGAVTGDAGKAAIAGGTQFIKSEVIESYAIKAGKTAFDNVIKAGGGIETAQKAADAATTKWKGFGGAATSIAGVLALGGDEEAALTAGVQHLVTEFGAERLGEMMGVENLPGFETVTDAQGAVGGAAIAAVVSFLRTGDVEQAAISGATSYLFSVNPVLGIAAMALQFLTAKKPSYKSGYASFDFDEFKMNTYSQGDYDPSKANPSNVEFSQKLLNPMIPYMQELEKTTGFDFKGDLQIHYSQGKKGAGVYYTIGNRDQEGLSAREMFLNRPDYYDGKDQSTQDGGKVYRRHFQATQEGLEALYEALYADLEYIAKNKITDLTHYTGVVKSAEEIQAGLKNTGFDMSSLSFMQDGGKILDRNQKVLYNSNQAKNYGLVNKKGKAPPSARADDVPMTLKEGDFVLSQPAVNLYGKDTIERMVQRAANEAGTNLKSGGKVPVNVHNGEYIIPKKLTEYIGSNVLENMNNRGLMSVGDKTNI